MSATWCSEISGGIRIAVQITPNAKKSEVVGLLEDALKIKLQAQPIEGKANEALVRYLAERLNVPKSSVTITHGHTNRRKLVEINAGNLTADFVRQSLLPAQSRQRLAT
jgi:uncharacterized protein (TIGR00251 family)